MQDWASDEFLRGPICQESRDFGYTTKRDCNKLLKKLLKEHLGIELEQTFITNCFVFVKPGSMNARIPVPLMAESAKEFAVPQIQIVQPKLVICLGLTTFQATQRALTMKPTSRKPDAIENPYMMPGSQTLIHAQAHTGILGQLNRGEKVSGDWAKMAEKIRKR